MLKHRGRHRRRRRGRALRASLAGTALALTAAATLISTSQAAGGETPGALSALSSAGDLRELRLHETLTDTVALDTLTDEMGGAVTLDDVLRSANHVMRGEDDCLVAEKAHLPVEPMASRVYCWESGDAVNDQWTPRSVTTSRNNQVIASGWTHTGVESPSFDRGTATDGTDTTGTGVGGADRHGADDRGLARVAFIDARDPASLMYRWVLLVVPTADGRGFEGLRSRLGGMAWYEDKLIVTARGTDSDKQRDDSLYVFDLSRFLRADVIDSDAIGKADDGWSAHRYRYALPAVASYASVSGRGCDARDSDGVPCFGSLSLDRTSAMPSIVASEWFEPSHEKPARIWRYGLDTGTERAGLLTITGRQGSVDAAEAYETGATGVRGVLSHKGEWYVGQTTDDPDKPGTLWRQDEDEAKAAQCAAGKPGIKSDLTTHACWGHHSASLSYSPETGEVWTLTDPISKRVLYAVKLSDIENTLG